MSASPSRRGLPTPEQIAWHKMEIEMFLAIDPCTWQGRDKDDHSTPLPQINPARADANQWCEVAKSFGAKQILFVAKHTGGFCWWQTKTSDYSIKNTPYKNGKGDLLAELAESCVNHGLRLGVYIYPGDDLWGAGIGSGGRTKDPAKQEAYNRVLRQQWTEVLTRYGEIAEVWFDGSCVIELGDILHAYAPKAMVFQGPHATLRWPGNEQGIAPYPTWQTVKKADAISGVSTSLHSDPDGDVWLPMEIDTPLLDHKWFWGANTDHMIKSHERLMAIYYQSVGRGCVLLLNATPDTSGLIPESHVEHYRQFGAAIKRIYENKKGQTRGKGRTLELRFDKPAPVTHIITMEDICYGQIVRAYEVDGLIDGKWTKLLEGTSIGYKRIDVINAIVLEGLRLRVTQSVDQPVIACLAGYEVADESMAVGPDAGLETWQEVAGWRPIELSRYWQTFDIDLTPYIRIAGQYEIQVRPAAGAAALDIQEITVIIARTEAPRLMTKLSRPYAWLIRRTDLVMEGTQGETVLRLMARIAGAGRWDGQLFIRQIK